MAYRFDEEWAAAVAPLLRAMERAPRLPVGDAHGRRAAIDGMMTSFGDRRPAVADVEVVTHRTVSFDGAEIEMRWYTKQGSPITSAVLYLHGGGMICGSLDIYDSLVRNSVSKSGVPTLAVEYRLAPEHPHPAPVEDCFAALAWLSVNASSLGIDVSRIAVYGDSAGGGLAAGTALLARDRGITLARQILVYPMIDDRTEVDPALVPFLMWTYEDNETGWRALLGDAYRTDEASPYAAPARATNLSGLAPAYIEVGELDAFRDENIAYARRLSQAGVSVELHVHPGVPHAFEALAPQVAVSRRSAADRLRALTSF